jgi:hypothetical protein
MEHDSAILVSVLAVAILTACGGGGSGGITNLEPVAAASPPPTTERVVTIVGRERAGTRSNPVPRLDPLVVHRVQDELDKIERALGLVDDGRVEKHEALEVVRDARAELQRNQPNKLKLRSLLSGLVQGVQMLDGGKSAGDSLGQLVPMV